MIKVIIIDDEPLARSLVREYLQNYPDIEIVAECGDGFDGVKAISTHKPDLLFLDIQMPKINGFEMLELLEEKPSVIFTTAFDEYAIKAFEINAIDYLLKPFNKERFDKALNRWRDTKPNAEEKTAALADTLAEADNQPQRVVIKLNNKIKIIPFNEIIYLEAAEDYVFVHTAEGRFMKHKTMIFFENALDKNQFVRCHRSYIVDVQQITRLEIYEKDSHVAILKNGAKVPVSKSGYGRLKLVLGV
ncbi:MAG: response regulator [Chitinophagales bacterium]|nr:response regulator [Chitinophagales bacterium]